MKRQRAERQGREGAGRAALWLPLNGWRGLDRRQLATIARNSFLGSFLPEEEIAGHLARIDDYVARHGGSDA